MSYAVPPPVAAPAPSPVRRPVPVTLAAALLALMGVVGLGYAVATLVVVPGSLDRFRDSTGAADGSDVEAYTTGVWIVAALGTVLAVILVALYVVLALGLLRGSNASRIGTWVVCGLGLLFGCGSTVTVAVQRSGEGDPGTLGVTLSEAYPDYWIGLNLTLAVAQMIGYVIVAVLLVAAPAAYFGRGTRAEPSALASLPPYGSTSAYPGLPQPGAFPPAAPGSYPPAAPGSYPPAAPGSYPPAAPGSYPPAAVVPPASGPPQPGRYPPGASPGPPQPGPDDEYWARPSG